MSRPGLIAPRSNSGSARSSAGRPAATSALASQIRAVRMPAIVLAWPDRSTA
jgi:hypothetical protein